MIGLGQQLGHRFIALELSRTPIWQARLPAGSSGKKPAPTYMEAVTLSQNIQVSKLVPLAIPCELY